MARTPKTESVAKEEIVETTPIANEQPVKEEVQYVPMARVERTGSYVSIPTALYDELLEYRSMYLRLKK